MTRFTEQDEPGDDVSAVRGWLTAELDRLRAEKSLPSETGWQVCFGRRETTLPGGQRMVKSGFQVRASFPDEGAARPLICFIPLEDLIEEEERTNASLVLSLWLDRVLL